MLRAKRRRTRMHDNKGNPIFNTNNATTKQNNYVMKNNYLESLKTKGNDHNKCKRYYSDKEVIEKHQINLKDSALIINFSFHDFTNDQGCTSGLLSALYENTNQLSGKYKFLGNYTYYLDKAIDAKDDNGNTVKSIVFMTYVGELGPYGFWGIIGFPFSESQQTFEEAVQYYYEYIIIKNGLKYSDFTNVCSVLSHKLGSNDITKYYSSTWNEGTNTNTSIRVTMTPDTKHSSADKIKHNMTFRYCKTSIEQNPILGYRKQLKDCENCDIPKNPINTIYKDNYAKTCGKFRKEDSNVGKFCAYNNVILSKQNNNGIVDASYNYSTSQYLSRPNFMKCNNVYKKSNPRFSTQGAVSGGSRLNRLKYQTIVKSQQKYNTLGNTLFQFKLKVGYWEPTTQLKLYGYGDGNGITTIPGSLEPDNFKGNEIPTLNITENSFAKTYGLEIYFDKKIEDQISENMLNNFKIILNYNDVNIQINFSDLTQFYNYGVQVEYDFDYDDTHPNYNLIKNIISNGDIIGKSINIIFIFNKLTSENILTIKKLLNNKNISNMVNGVYPTNLYRNTRPIYKQIYSKNVKCKGRSCNGLLQFCPN